MSFEGASDALAFFETYYVEHFLAPALIRRGRSWRWTTSGSIRALGLET